MEMNYEQAFSYIKEDKEWKKKLTAGGALSLLSAILFILPAFFVKADTALLISIFVVCFIVNLLLILGLIGYPYITANNRINNNEEILPCWCNFGRLITAGLKFIVGYFLFSIPISILSALAFVILTSAAIVQDDVLKAFFALLTFLAILVISFFMLAYSLGSYLMMSVFAKDLKVLSFIDFKEGLALLKNNWVNYLVLLLVIIAVGIIAQIASIILCITVIGIILLPWLFFYIGLVMADLLAQFVKTKKS